MRTLLADNIISFPLIRSPDFEPKPKWWRENEFCDFHRGKGHKTNNCFSLKHTIQDLINSGDITIDNPKSNNDHTAFIEPFPKHGQEVSTSQPNMGAKRNYAYPGNNLVINMIEPCLSESCNVITIVRRDRQNQSTNTVT